MKLENGASDAEILYQVRDYERSQEILNGVNEDLSDRADPFDYCWEQTQRPDGETPITPSRPIPGTYSNI